MKGPPLDQPLDQAVQVLAALSPAPNHKALQAGLPHHLLQPPLEGPNLPCSSAVEPGVQASQGAPVLTWHQSCIDIVESNLLVC